MITDPAILAGKPIVKGSRLAVEFILELNAKSWSSTQILENYLGLTGDDLSAGLARQPAPGA